jgi:hypothetical protein
MLVKRPQPKVRPLLVDILDVRSWEDLLPTSSTDVPFLVDCGHVPEFLALGKGILKKLGSGNYSLDKGDTTYFFNVDKVVWVYPD